MGRLNGVEVEQRLSDGKVEEWERERENLPSASTVQFPVRDCRTPKIPSSQKSRLFSLLHRKINLLQICTEQLSTTDGSMSTWYSMLMSLVHINHLLHLIVTAHENPRAIVDVLGDDGEHSFHAGIYCLTTGCIPINQVVHPKQTEER